MIAVILCICALSSGIVLMTGPAGAAAVTGTACITGFPRSSDDNADYSGVWGRPALQFMNGYACNENVYINLYSMDAHESNICYCTELGTDVKNGYVYHMDDESYWDTFPSGYNSTLTPAQIRDTIGRILYYGYCGKISGSWVSQNADGRKKLARAWATQILIWETIVGERSEYFAHIDPAPYARITKMVKGSNPIREDIISEYTEIVSKVQNHVKIASFTKSAKADAGKYSLNWDGTRFTRTFTDTRGVLSDFTFSCSDSSVKLTKSGDKLTVSSTKALSGDILITAKKNEKRKTLIMWTDGAYAPGSSTGQQDFVSYGSDKTESIVSYLKVNTETGNIKITKSSEDGKVSGVSFTLSGQGIEKTVSTGTSGEVTVNDLPLGSYTVTENMKPWYTGTQTKSVTVTKDKTVNVSFVNSLKKGSVRVTKLSEDGFYEGIKFHLYGKSLSGENVDLYALTDNKGVALFSDVPIGNGYILEETDTAERYIVPGKENVEIVWNTVTGVNVENRLKKGSLKVIKEDMDDEGIKLDGAVFLLISDKDSDGIYDTEKDEEYLRISGSDAGEYIVTDIPYGSYILIEDLAPEGYIKSDDIYPFSIKNDGETVEIHIKNEKIPETTTETTTEEETTHAPEPETTTDPVTKTTTAEETTTEESTTLETTTEETTTKPVEIPHTGDKSDTGVILLFCLMSLAVICICIMLCIRRKEGGRLE